LFLVGLAVTSIILNTKISYPALIPLLVPVPFVFQSQLAQLIALIQRAKIKKLGFIEFEQNSPNEETVAVARLQAQEGIVFAYLNQFFALRTKILLAVLAHSNGGLSIIDFRSLAFSF